MSSIHIGIASKRGSTRIFEVYYHVPNNNNKYPGGVSELSSLEQTEIDALFAGTIVEVKDTFRAHQGESKQAAAVRLKAKYPTIASNTQTKINEEYAFYGETIEVP
jgi:hypothetical protein